MGRRCVAAARPKCRIPPLVRVKGTAVVIDLGIGAHVDVAVWAGLCGITGSMVRALHRILVSRHSVGLGLTCAS